MSGHQSPAARSNIDPQTASAGFTYERLGNDEDACAGRVYYWFDPSGSEPAIADDDLRKQHAEISDDEWRRLLAAAFDRGERAFLIELKRDNPDLFESEDGLRAAFLGFMFGPGRPSEETLTALDLHAPEKTAGGETSSCGSG